MRIYRGLFATPLLLASVTLLGQPQTQRLFPCEIVDFSLRGTSVDAMCFTPQSANFSLPVRVNELDDNGNLAKDGQGNVIAPRNAHLSLNTQINRQWANLTFTAGTSDLQLGKSYRITTLDTYPVGGQPVPFVVATFDFDYPPKVRFPCRLVDYRITGKTTMQVECASATIRSPLDYDVTVSDLVNGAATNPRTGHLTLDPKVEKQWGTVTFPSPPSPARFVSDKKYRIESLPSYRLIPQDPNSQAIAYNVEKMDFATSKDVSVAIPYGSPNVQPLHSQDGRRRFLITSKVAIDDAALDTETMKRGIASIYEDLPVVRTKLDANFYKMHIDNSSDEIGRVFVWIADPGPKSLNTHLTVTGLKNVLDAEVEVSPDARLKLPGAPVGKDDATLYGKFLNQAGPGAKPGWAADVKFAPMLAYAGGGWFFNLQVLADVGLGSVEDNKTTNTIETGVGLTRFISTGRSLLPGLQVTPHIDFETDRQGHHQNLLFDGDVQLFGKGWLHSIKDQTEVAYAHLARDAASRRDDPPDPAVLALPKIGFLFQAFLGTEAGRALSADSVKSSDESSSATLPTYSIARIRPKIAATVEIRRLALSASITGRYLFAMEAVTREQQVSDATDPSKQTAMIYLHQAKGFRPYGEAGISYQLDNEGHIALSVIYKLGSLPPNFDYVNTVQTGITFKY